VSSAASPARAAAGAGAAVRVVLGSSSPARLSTLRAAGLRPEVVVPGVDEDAVVAAVPHGSPGARAVLLAEHKSAAVAPQVVAGDGPAVVIGCDSVLELDGEAYGKPGSATEAVRRWRSMRGRSGVLHTGHSLRLVGLGAEERHSSAVASALVHFADLTDDEVDAYVATGEPLGVAGGFTLDGLGGAYVRGIEGDPHTVVGISLPLLRELLAAHGIAWHRLWRG